ncbi:MAG: hypothetical protein AAGH41_11080 [Pseudomonadota bacterium]
MSERPLADLLSDAPELARAESLSEAEQRLREVFVAAQGQANAYSAERIQEVYEVAERALALSAAFPAPAAPGTTRTGAAGPWWRRARDLVGQYAAGLLLAACAPLVADSSAILAVACGVAAALSLIAARRPDGKLPEPKLLEPRAVRTKFESLLSAADQSLRSMTAPRALDAPQGGRATFQDDDVLQLLQDVMALGRLTDDEDMRVLSENAERLASRAGYQPIWDDDPQLFEVMTDPQIREPLMLKPALIHKNDPTRTVFGVVVRS